MKRTKLDGFINRYNLGGEIESVIIKSTDAELSVKMISDDKTLLGNVTMPDAEFPVGDFAIYTTSQLKGLLTVLDDNVAVEDVSGTALKFSDKKTKMQYMLAAPSVIPAVPDLKTLPAFDAEVKLDDDFVNTFVKSKSALADADTFTFTHKNGKGEIILGYSSINTNRVAMEVDCKCEVDVEPIAFSAKYLKAILVANRGAKSSSLKISSKGLSALAFESDEYVSKYFLVQIK